MPQHSENSGSGMAWGRFTAMILTSTLVMFVLMYQLVYSTDHAYFSMNRLMASLAMGCVMIVIMLGFMWSMYQGKAAKIAVLAAGIIGATAMLATNLTQALIDDTAFMRSMIPHHSIAINNASKASISDPRVRKLADEIIRSQVKEIAQMNFLLADIERNGERGHVKLSPVAATLSPEMEAGARAVVEN
jgi:hypothetical protein